MRMGLVTVCRVLPLVAVMAATLPAHAADENSMLMGGLLLMGNDGAAEAGENPAYLVFPKHQASGSVNMRLTGEYAHNVGVTGLATSETRQWLAAGDISAAGHLPGKKWAVGLSVNEPRTPTYLSLRISSLFYNPAINDNIYVDISNRTVNNGLAAGFAYKLTAHESVGVRVKYSARGDYDKNRSTYSFAGSPQAVEDLKESITHSISGSISYLVHHARADFSLMFSNMGFQYQAQSFSRTAAGTAAGNTYHAGEFLNRAATEPYLIAGTRVRTVGDLHLYAEAAAQPPLTISGHDNVYRDRDPKGVVARTSERVSEPGFAAGAGLALGMTPDLTFFAGARAQKSQSATTYTASGPAERTVDNLRITIAMASLGASLRRDSFLLQAGVQYLYQQIEQSKDARYINGTTLSTETRNTAITINGWGFYLGAAADF